MTKSADNIWGCEQGRRQKNFRGGQQIKKDLIIAYRKIALLSLYLLYYVCAMYENPWGSHGLPAPRCLLPAADVEIKI